MPEPMIEQPYRPDRPPVQPDAWPAAGQHLWGPWMAATGLPKASQYRLCVHPLCDAVDRRQASRG